MSESAKSHLDHLPSRRVFVKTSTAAAVGLLGAWGAQPAETAAQEPPVVALTKAARDQMTADQIGARRACRPQHGVARWSVEKVV